MNDCDLFIIDPFFLPFGRGTLFCIFVAPKTVRPRAGVLYLHPFAEEMHKSRRMASLQAHRFAQAGYAVLQVDLPGCGDSFGDFEDATWESWLASALRAHDWLSQKIKGQIALWGLRLGATLAVDLSSQLTDVAGLILWQPVVDGKRFINQFLRIRIASEMSVAQHMKPGTQELRSQLASGDSVEVGGYMLSSAMASDIDKLNLSTLHVHAPVFWFEVTPTLTDQPSQSSMITIEAWNNTGTKVTSQVLQGEPFWVTQEISECLGLLHETTKALESIAP